MADNLTNLICQLSQNLGASTSWNAQGLYKTCTGTALPFTIYGHKHLCIIFKGASLKLAT